MKSLIKIIQGLLVSIALLFITGMQQQASAQPGITVSFQQFYDELSPYGEWVDDPDYGYIWVPNVEPDFQPYATNGRWVMTDYGNTWVSNYNWGWAPFHYGRWNFNNRFGWSWVPGYEWGPAWVSWRTGGGYYGWAPLGPGVGISVNISIPANYWIFVPQRYLLSPSIHRYYAPRRTIVQVYNRTTIINNTYVRNNRTYITGPRRNEIQRITRTRVPVHQVTSSNRPGVGRVSGRSVEMYRPDINRNTQARPTRISNANQVRAQNSRPTANTNTNTRTTTDRSTRVESGSRSNTTPRVQKREETTNARQAPTTGRSNSSSRTTSRPSVSRSSQPQQQRAPAEKSRTSTQRPTTPAQPSRPAPERVNSQPRASTRSTAPSRPSRNETSHSSSNTRGTSDRTPRGSRH